MKRIIMIIAGVLVILAASASGNAQMVSETEALRVAENWIRLIIHLKGEWGGTVDAKPSNVRELRVSGRKVGFVCDVIPHGYVVIPLRKEMVAVKMYSATNDLNTKDIGGIASLLKDSMGNRLRRIERQLGPIDLIEPTAMKRILEVDHQPMWDELTKDPELFATGLESGVIEMNYQQSQELLTSNWHQGDPYNRLCPPPSVGASCTASRCMVGCGPLADSQIMRYWAWPPYGEDTSPYNDTYDWVNMPDVLTTASPTAQINAVTELTSEVGLAGNASYCILGCDTGNTMLDSMSAFMNHYRYSPSMTREERRLYASTSAWFDAIKAQLELNRPVLYVIPQHSVVVDGWQEVGSPGVQEIHVIYGWGGSNDGWYTLDYDIPGTDSSWEWEKMAPNIVPEPSVGAILAGTYNKDASFPYRYFDCDCTGASADFSPGQNLQFLPAVSARDTSTTGNYIRFSGTTGSTTRLFSIKGSTGTASVAGIRLYKGALRLYQNGSVQFH